MAAAVPQREVSNLDYKWISLKERNQTDQDSRRGKEADRGKGADDL